MVSTSITSTIKLHEGCHRKKRLQTDSWMYQEFGPPEVVSVDALTGLFAMLNISMSRDHCWVTRAMPNVSHLEP